MGVVVVKGKVERQKWRVKWWGERKMEQQMGEMRAGEGRKLGKERSYEGRAGGNVTDKKELIEEVGRREKQPRT